MSDWQADLGSCLPEEVDFMMTVVGKTVQRGS